MGQLSLPREQPWDDLSSKALDTWVGEVSIPCHKDAYQSDLWFVEFKITAEESGSEGNKKKVGETSGVRPVASQASVGHSFSTAQSRNADALALVLLGLTMPPSIASCSLRC